jgi:hypothetical protein
MKRSKAAKRNREPAENGARTVAVGVPHFVRDDKANDSVMTGIVTSGIKMLETYV